MNIINKVKNKLIRKLLKLEDSGLDYVVVPKYQMDKLEPIRKNIYKLLPKGADTNEVMRTLYATNDLWDIANRRYPVIEKLKVTV